MNAAQVLSACLQSILNQHYPRELVRILVADGGSVDQTREIARQAYAIVLDNPLRTGEAGKAVALRAATADIVALIDSDNILPTEDWLARMVAPLADPDIIGSEPIRFTYRPQDGFITRYCALIGMNDPLCLFLGNYDKECLLTGQWTELPVKTEQAESYLKVFLRGTVLPTIGANGTLLRRQALLPFLHQPYFFDIDILAQLAREHPVAFAKVDTGIIHLYCGSSPWTFIRKQRRRVQDYFYHRALSMRRYPWQASSRRGLLRFTIYCATVVPLFWQSLKGYLRKPDPAWWFHPFACLATFWIYAAGALQGFLHPKPAARTQWKQIG